MKRALLVVVYLSAFIVFSSFQTTLVSAKNIVVVVLAEPGHVNTIIPLAMELKKRGHSVSFAFFEGENNMIEEYGFKVMSLGISPFSRENFKNYVNVLFQNLDLLEAVSLLLRNFLTPIYGPTFTALHNNFTENPPDLIITESMQFAALDVAHILSIPVVLISHTVSMLQEFLPPAPHFPSIASANPDAINPSSHYDQIMNVFSPYYFIGRMAFVFLELQAERAKYGPYSSAHAGTNALVLVPSVWGLEIARPVPPNVHLVGNMWPLPDKSDLWKSPTFDWLEESNTPVLYVSLGSLAVATEEVLQSLSEGLVLAHKQLNIRILWALRDNQLGRDAIVENLRKYPGIRIEKWSDQKRVLAHKNVLYFFSHGGQNSVVESLSLGKPLIVMPFMGDQPGNAVLVVHAGAGYKISPQGLTVGGVVSVIRKATENKENITKAAEKIAFWMKEAGGSKRAVELVEDYMDNGIARLLHPVDKTPLWIKLLPHATVVCLLLITVKIVKMVVYAFLRLFKPKRD